MGLLEAVDRSRRRGRGHDTLLGPEGSGRHGELVSPSGGGGSSMMIGCLLVVLVGLLLHVYRRRCSQRSGLAVRVEQGPPVC